MNKIFTKYYLFFSFILLLSIHANAQSIGGVTSGAALVCPDSINSGIILLNGYVGTILNWESSINGGITWNTISNISNQNSYNNLTQTTCYRAIVQLGSFPPDTSTCSCVTIFDPSIGGTLSGGGAFCTGSGNGTLNLTGSNGNVLYWMFSTNNGVSWNSISDTTTTLNYTNITQNTIYSVVVQNGASCPSDTSSQASFAIDALTNAGTVFGNDTVCYNSNSGSLFLSGTVGSIINWISSTDNGETWTIIPNTTLSQNYSGLISTTRYSALVKNGSCQADTSGFAEILINNPPYVNAGNDTTIIQGQTITLTGSGSGMPIWAPSNGLNSNNVFSPTTTLFATTTYILTVTDTNGCINEDDVVIKVIPPIFNGMVSNLFTPNGDGINDSWYIQDIQNFPDNEVFVFNIYGNQVYSKKAYANDWQGTFNGSELPDGTYYYVLKFDKSEKVIKGSIDILRNK